MRRRSENILTMIVIINDKNKRMVIITVMVTDLDLIRYSVRLKFKLLEVCAFKTGINDDNCYFTHTWIREKARVSKFWTKTSDELSR